MKKRVLYIVLAVVFIISIILTCTIGLKVDLGYAEGDEIALVMGKEIQLSEIKDITNDIWKESNVQKIEYWNDSVLIKAREMKSEDLELLCTKLNEKYGTEFKLEDMSVKHTSNIKLRNVISPYIIPVGLATILVGVFYGVRHKSAKRMIDLFKYIVIAEGLLYSVHAILRVPVSSFTMPIAIVLYTAVILINTAKLEFEDK